MAAPSPEWSTPCSTASRAWSAAGKSAPVPAPDEFDLIRRLFAPLATDPGALDLRDDAALVDCPPGHRLVMTADAIVSGVHFLADDPPDLVARKLMRVNLSDLAAMGAEPKGALLVSSFASDTKLD